MSVGASETVDDAVATEAPVVEAVPVASGKVVVGDVEVKGGEAKKEAKKDRKEKEKKDIKKHDEDHEVQREKKEKEKEGKLFGMNLKFLQKEKKAPVAPSGVPAYRFISTSQGHGYPITPIAAPAEKVHGHAEHSPTDMRKTGAKLAAMVYQPMKKPKKSAHVEAVPAYRFISSMAGYGYPVPCVQVKLRSFSLKVRYP